VLQENIDLALALQMLPTTLALVPQLQSKVDALEKEIFALKAANLSGWVTLQEGAKAVGLTTPALRQTIKRNMLAENRVWKQAERNGRVFVHVERLKEEIGNTNANTNS
jgi:hypothetical protein